MPDPDLVNAPVPEIIPEKVVSTTPAEVKVLLPKLIFPAPAIDPTVSF